MKVEYFEGRMMSSYILQCSFHQNLYPDFSYSLDVENEMKFSVQTICKSIYRTWINNQRIKNVSWHLKKQTQFIWYLMALWVIKHWTRVTQVIMKPLYKK